uniref:Tyrosine specific protein phosphatases domain-containing protein n=1 Tax=Stegastes partitus TaxID=144197 RepID=A0A3B4ZIZ2_9TELE
MGERDCIPDRWLDYCPVGRRIPGTRFIAFKNQELGLIINLTFTRRYYELSDAVRQFLKEDCDNDKLIGVHWTHGLNRTVYLVCRYLINVDGYGTERQNYLCNLQNATKRSNDRIDEPQEEAIRGLAVERPPQTTRQDQRPPQTTRQDQRPPQSTRQDQRPAQITRQDQRPPQSTRQDQRPPQTNRQDQRPPQTTRQEEQLFQNITAATEQDRQGSSSGHKEAEPLFSDDPHGFSPGSPASSHSQETSIHPSIISTPSSSLGSIYNHQLTSACFWTVGGSRRTRREPTLHGENMEAPHRKIPGVLTGTPTFYL